MSKENKDVVKVTGCDVQCSNGGTSSVPISLTSFDIDAKYEWQRLVVPNGPLFESFIEIMKGIEPNTPKVPGLITYDPKNYRCYVARDISGQLGCLAIGIACYLPKCNVLHVEDFALNPKIYGKGMSRGLYSSWREFVCSEWPEANKAGISNTMIEVYLHNVEPWKKIMGVEKVKVPQPAIFIREDTPIVLMARDLPCSPEVAYAEWQEYQQGFYTALKKPESVSSATLEFQFPDSFNGRRMDFTSKSTMSNGSAGSSGKQTAIVWHELFGWYNTGSIYDGQFPAEFSPAKGLYIPPAQHFDNGATSKSHSLIKVCGTGDDLHWITPVPASKEQLEWVHDSKYITKLEKLNPTGGDAGEFSTFGPGGYEIARLAVGGAIQAVDAVIKGVVKNAYALVRPCGHHAECDTGKGFCLINNIAVATRYAQKCGLKRVAIIDYDAHHGNGTNKIFYEDDSVLYISTHQNSLYPLKSGSVNETGEGKGVGYTINIPLPPGTGEGGYDETWRRVIVPAIDAFHPDIIFVSSGFNASAMDQMACMMLSSGAFVKFTEYLMMLANRHCADKLVFVHEGGYSPSTMPYALVSVLETMMNRKTKTLDPYREEIQSYGGHDCTSEQRAVIDAVIDRHCLVAKIPLLSPRISN
jgi:acetoin utilization deacetylase AcuC-like enzyme